MAETSSVQGFVRLEAAAVSRTSRDCDRHPCSFSGLFRDSFRLQFEPMFFPVTSTRPLFSVHHPCEGDRLGPAALRFLVWC